MIYLRIFYFIISLFCSVVCFGDSARIRVLRPSESKMFLQDVSQNFISKNQALEIQFRLYIPHKNKNEVEKFGRLIFFNSNGNNIVQVEFDESTKTFTYGVKESAFDIKLINECVSSECKSDFLVNQSFFHDLILSPQDLLLLFSIDTCSHKYLGPSRILGRPVQQFLLDKDVEIDGVKYKNIKLSFDNKFLVPLHVDFFDDHQKLGRRILVNSFKKFDEIWSPKIIELSEFSSKKSARLEIFSIKIRDCD